MFYRENGQFKTTYRADQQIFPIAQDRVALLIMLAIAFVAVPMIASDYMFRAILIPFLIFSLAAVGVNILVGYCGQISLGTGGFMAVAAYASYNFFLRVPIFNDLILVIVFGGVMAAVFGVLFGLPSLRIKGFYLAVATLAAQFFVDWATARIKWLTNYAPSGSVNVSNLKALGIPIEGPHRDDQFWLDQIEAANRKYGIEGGRNVTPDRYLEDGDTLELEGVTFDVSHCPGHTPGHVVFHHAPSKFAIVGDVLFQNSVGRTDLPGGDHQALISAIRTKLLPLGDDINFICGHGAPSSFGRERKMNPFLQD